MKQQHLGTGEGLVIATHNGAFHADDVFAVAVLQALHPDADVVRTRDPQVLQTANFCVDVGGAWDPSNGKFDHHQKGFAGARESGVVYASAGLVWAAYGSQFVRMLCPGLEASAVQQVAVKVDEQLVQHLDMADTGAAQGAPGYFGLSALVSAFNTTRDEERLADQSFDRADSETLARVSADLKLRHFHSAVAAVGQVLTRVVLQLQDEVTSAQTVRGAQRLMNGRVLLLPESGLAWIPVVCQEMPDVLFVVYPDSADQQFQLRTVPLAPESFQARKDLPTPWAGLRDAELAKVTGVSDAVFCHNARFIGGAVSKEGALRMAELALQTA